MGIVFALLPISILLGGGALCAYLWSVRSGQLDDLDTPAMRMLFDDDESPKTDEEQDP